MDRRSFLIKAAAIGTAVALPFQRVTQKAQDVLPKALDTAGPKLLPSGTRLVGYEKGPRDGWVGWVEELQSGVGNTVGWLSEKGIFHSVDDLKKGGWMK